MSQFYFALTSNEAQNLLKEEVRHRYPELSLSYSRPGFLTFKAPRPINFSPLFCHISGICLERLKKSQLDFKKFWFYPLSPETVGSEDLVEISQHSSYLPRETVQLVIGDQGDQFWVGTFTLAKHHLFHSLVPYLKDPELNSIIVPSRAYFKIREIHEAYELPFDYQEIVLELGAAPGGASLYLLQQDLKILGVDPGEMDPKVKSHINFKHLKRPFETLQERDLPSDIDWIICDVNLPPTVVMKEIFRFLNFLSPRGVVVNLKMNDSKHVRLLPQISSTLRERGFSQLHWKYLPSHRKEITLVALQS